MRHSFDCNNQTLDKPLEISLDNSLEKSSRIELMVPSLIASSTAPLTFFARITQSPQEIKPITESDVPTIERTSAAVARPVGPSLALASFLPLMAKIRPTIPQTRATMLR